MIFNEVNRILVLAPHPDDAEFGLGGTIAKLIAQKKEVFIIVYSLCEKSTPDGFEVGTIEKEMYASLASLGVPRENLIVYDFAVRDFPAHRQQILEEIIVQRNKIKPDLVFIPSSSDIHQDHKTIYEEGKRAFKFNNLLGYEMPWNNFGFNSFVYNVLEESHIQSKIDAINLYKSQGFRLYSNPEFIRSLAILRGGQIMKKYAESFELIRMISA
ncbi:MAG: PIG-L family deacetylase [Bacteroidia bacterium]|nr:PIG-L family deacetylase [Bacteroidota bacterium]MBP9083172.1 PIG-L family deacetylase [Bacteroidia bacterium]MBK7388170.1 PIG-L family deacetylase [Bacteroidota bacterium]MBK8413638.1 PIG-L family deacetylase [Bacteroidota bacterium]MBK8876935.1 PIG-L family deacetylase [Bacteroidota bacterium]